MNTVLQISFTSRAHNLTNNNHLASHLIRLFLTFSIVFPAIASGKETVKTNEQLIARGIIDPFWQSITPHIDQQSRLQIFPFDQSEMSLWVSKMLTDSCVHRNYFVYSSADSIVQADCQIRISDATSQISYRSAGRKWLVGSRRFNRKVTVRYHLQILDKNAQILVSRRIENSFNDHLSGINTNELENPELSFTSGTKTSNSFIKRWIEPALITAATSFVIYTFYTLRSNN